MKKALNYILQSLFVVHMQTKGKTTPYFHMNTFIVDCNSCRNALHPKSYLIISNINQSLKQIDQFFQWFIQCITHGLYIVWGYEINLNYVTFVDILY